MSSSQTKAFFQKTLLSFLVGGISILAAFPSWGANLPITLFPLTNYSQDVETWLPSHAANYNIPLISPTLQQRRMQELYQHLFSTADDAMSPWSANFINAILGKHPGLAELQNKAIANASNRNKTAADINYGENFRPYAPEWIDKITANMPGNYPIKFSASHRAILVKNASLRILPTHEVLFRSYEIAGEGYPFDNLQASQLWAGTPVYLLNYSKDQQWALIISPATMGWVEADKLGMVDDKFIARWQTVAKQGLAAITQIEIPIFDASEKIYQFSSYLGAVFPLQETNDNFYKILIPIRDIKGAAKIQYGLVNQQAAIKMPLPATRANFAMLLSRLKNRPYGWGGIYGYNDCSAELQSLFLPFGIWLPRNSSQQVYMGNRQDRTADTPAQRIAYLRDKAHPLMSIVYIGGHVFLYLGNYSSHSANAPSATEVIIYQNTWGLSPPDSSFRAVIGQSVFIPLLLSYPENPKLKSWAEKNYFVVSHLDEMPAIPIDLPTLFFADLKASDGLH